MKLTTTQRDRAGGVLLGQAIGDALGVPYEFARPITAGQAKMIGGGLGPYAPGEWSDDTQMAICIARVVATGADLTSADALDAIAAGFIDWYRNGATDIGNLTRQVLSRAAQGEGRLAARMAARANVPPSSTIALDPSTALTVPDGTGAIGWMSSRRIPLFSANCATRSSGT